MTTMLEPEDRALVRAALLDGNSATSAFREWRSLYDFEGQHEGGRFHILPLLFANMSRLGMEDPVMGRLRGVHRFGWAKGQRRLHAAAKVIDLFQHDGIPVLLTKGIALAKDYYPEVAARQMQDIDLLVPASRADNALRLLASEGWALQEPSLRQGGDAKVVFMARYPGAALRGHGGEEIDLHWRPLHESSSPFLAEWFWRDAEPVSFAGCSALRPAPAPLLLHSLTHGLRSTHDAPLRWIADATMILRRAGDRIDWEEFWSVARRTAVEMRLAWGLKCLEDVTGMKLPRGAQHRPLPSFIELLERPALSRPVGAVLTVAERNLLFIANTLRLMRAGQVHLYPKIARNWFRK